MFVCPTFLFVALDFSEPNHPCLATFCNCILSGYKDIIYVLKNIISVSLTSTKHLLRMSEMLEIQNYQPNEKFEQLQDWQTKQD